MKQGRFFHSSVEALRVLKLNCQCLYFQYCIYFVCVKSVNVQRDGSTSEDTLSAVFLHFFFLLGCELCLVAGV